MPVAADRKLTRWGKFLPAPTQGGRCDWPVSEAVREEQQE